MRKYLAFDIEIAKVIPEEEADWKYYRPLGITCAAAIGSDGRQWLWYAERLNEFQPVMSMGAVQKMVVDLEHLVNQGYTILTWNGLGFDFDILMEESGGIEGCKELALNHIDMMFHFFCSKGHRLGLDAAAKGMGLPGKPEGMDGTQAPILWVQKEYNEVLSYVTQDVKNTLALALLVEDGELNWISRDGNAMSWPCQEWLTVKEAMTLPDPDTSWMTDPWPRSRFYGWIKNGWIENE